MFAVIQELLNDANSLLNSTEPWKKQGEEKSNILIDGIAYVYYISRMFSPFIPEATSKVLKAMGIKEDTKLDDPISIDLNTITKPEILFMKK
jgi:methionyl-tRNA synthetase